MKRTRIQINYFIEDSVNKTPFKKVRSFAKLTSKLPFLSNSDRVGISKIVYDYDIMANGRQKVVRHLYDKTGFCTESASVEEPVRTDDLNELLNKLNEDKKDIKEDIDKEHFMMKKTFEISKITDSRRDKSLIGKYFIVTDDDNEISPTTNAEDGEPFFGSWTDDCIDYSRDNEIEILVKDLSRQERAEAWVNYFLP